MTATSSRARRTTARRGATSRALCAICDRPLTSSAGSYIEFRDSATRHYPEGADAVTARLVHAACSPCYGYCIQLLQLTSNGLDWAEHMAAKRWWGQPAEMALLDAFLVAHHLPDWEEGERVGLGVTCQSCDAAPAAPADNLCARCRREIDNAHDGEVVV